MARVGHFDMMAEDPQRAVDFYSKVFGWKFAKWDGPMEYWLITTGDRSEPGIDGGLGRGRPVDEQVLTITPVKLDEAIRAIESAGGKMLRPRGAIPGVGWFASFRGPDGNILGLMEEDPSAR